jgi:hypothetical protein
MDATPAWQPIPASVGTITVRLDAQPDNAQDFAFTAGGGLSPTIFSLDDDADATLPNTRTFSSLVARNAYTLAQPAVTGWSPSASCSDGSPLSNIDVGPAETVTCTFTNLEQGSVTKEAQPDHAQGFAPTNQPQQHQATAPRVTLSRAAARSKAKSALKRRFRRAYLRGTGKRLSCARLSASSYRCPFSFRYGKKRRAGNVTVKQQAAGTLTARVKVTRR